ncbi:similar to Saccharomyces cerevisiae YER004W FMP52 Protein of unknown function, localized to the mitochondrial outer membrane [Maudiozyma saulgeensis]|uniref:Protein FMP52, mitochondrial n=1 Tax=Maudiozyma saulgeensis TaxID=1789683 RepID=A0A1X7R429_9SACH|nr:similar to Saccharomyces cerevisiae YER004W FMP52 Protein of unknown function, localized to the mitochondrial outer membrane [Kazachstania saulgeensis]
MSALVLGATGLCGGFFLKFANASTKLSKVYSITRSKPSISVDEQKVDLITNKDSANWDQLIQNLDSDIQYLFTALATTRVAAGGTDQQYAIDHDLNMKLAKAAKQKGCKTVVVVSSMGANADSYFFYPKMKGEIEKDLTEMGFEKTIILRPGIILGDRGDKIHSGAGNGLATTLGGMFYRTKLQRCIGYPVEAEEISKVGVHLALNDTSNEKVRIVESKEILEIAAKIKDL